ncbi:MAG: YceD family protein [Candidatus Izemoplasmataceae bacterium]
MKWTLQALKKYATTDNTFEFTLDLNPFIEEGTDLLSISETKVTGSYTIEANTYYHFDLEIKTILTMACAITLDPVEVPLEIEVTETFSQDENDEYLTIEGITIDLLPVIWSNIYLEKPLRVVSPNAQFKSDQTLKKKDAINPMFKDLQKYKK